MQCQGRFGGWIGVTLAYVAIVHCGAGQALAQQNSSNRGNTLSQTASRGSSRVSRAPYMIGDSPYGLSSGNLSFDGVTLATLDHPVFDGHRFNLAEANATLPDDRILYSYRHFHNVSGNNVLGRGTTVDVERFLIGAEKSVLDGLASVDFRVPMLRELNSDLYIYDDGFGKSNVPGTTRSGELGNLAATVKVLLTNRPGFAVSSGVAVNIPTADDARILQDYLDPDVPIGNGSLADTSGGPTDFLIRTQIDNDTVNLTPYVAWQVTPEGGFFHQGFLQIDVPLNKSDVTVDGSGTISPSAVYDPETFSVLESGKVAQQTLLRLNLAMGYWVYRGNRTDLVRGVAGLFEAHYTGSLNDPNPFVANLTTLSDPLLEEPDVPVNLTAGNRAGSFNQVNLSAGCAVDLGGVLITNGVIVPVTQGTDRTFDFEYNLQVNKRF